MELTPEEKSRNHEEEQTGIEHHQSERKQAAGEWKLRFQRTRAFLIAYPLVLPLLLFAVIIVLVVVFDDRNNNSNTNTQSSGNYNYQYYTPTPQPSIRTATNLPSSTPLTSATPSVTPSIAENRDAVLHIDGSTKVPVANTQDAFYGLQDAMWDKDYEQALRMIRQKGNVFMVKNDSAVIVLEPFGYLTKVRIKNGGRTGWVTSSWIQLELSRPALNQALLRAARDGEVETVKSLLDRGADINVQDDKWGTTPLMEAADGGHIEVIKLLITRGANLNLKDKVGWTALSGLDGGVDERQKAIVRMLKRAGAK